MRNPPTLRHQTVARNLAFVTEVLSEQARGVGGAAARKTKCNTDDEIELKRQRYIQHPDNLYCLVISQTEVKVEMWARANRWERQVLTSLDRSARRLPGYAVGALISPCGRISKDFQSFEHPGPGPPALDQM